MSRPSLDPVARQVLDHYGLPAVEATLIALGNAGGFSGARLWRVEGADGAFCLRAWPPGGVTPQRLQTLHHWMGVARQAGLFFVPAVLSKGRGSSWVEMSSRLWDLTTWMPGRADFHAQPSRARLENACVALARLHESWARVTPSTGPCLAVQRRLACVRDWTALTASGWHPLDRTAPDDPLRPLAEHAWAVLHGRVDQVPGRLAPWIDRPLPLQPCLGDVWHDHILFSGEEVTGVIDYGSARVDHPAVDLARLLGSLAGNDAAAWAAGLGAYTRVRPLREVEQTLIAVLDETGTLLGLANWLRWHYHDGRTFEDRSAVTRRLGELLKRFQVS
jgi:Ser/Thr protein kinase RdoA (MazF antagonist)